MAFISEANIHFTLVPVIWLSFDQSALFEIREYPGQASGLHTHFGTQFCTWGAVFRVYGDQYISRGHGAAVLGRFAVIKLCYSAPGPTYVKIYGLFFLHAGSKLEKSYACITNTTIKSF